MHLLSPEGLHAVARDREQRARTAADDYRQKRLVEGSRVPGGKPVPMTRQVSQPMRRDTEFAIETAGLVTAFNETRAVDRIDQTGAHRWRVRPAWAQRRRQDHRHPGC